MALTVCNVGEIEALKRLVNNVVPGNLEARLYTNAYTPVEGSVVGTFTQSSASGYAAITLVGATWTFATVSDVTTATYPNITFTFTQADTINGYYITTASATQVVWAERFSSSFVLPGSGNIVLSLAITAD